MKSIQKVEEAFNQYNFYLPFKQTIIYNAFYECLVNNLGLNESFINNQFQQALRLQLEIKNAEKFRGIVINAWSDFLTKKINLMSVTPLSSAQEVRDLTEFLLKVLCEPKQYELTYVDELFGVFHKYLESNGGVSQVIQKSQMKLILTKLICSKIVLKQQQNYQQKFRTLLFDNYIQKTEKNVTNILVDIANEQDVLLKVFDTLIDIHFDNFTFYEFAKKCLCQLIKDYQQQMPNYVIDIILGFSKINIEKEKFLNDKFDSKQYSQQQEKKIQMEIIYKVKDNQDIKDILKFIHDQLFQSVDYRDLLRKLLKEDLHSKKYEQQFCNLFKEYNETHKRRAPQYASTSSLMFSELQPFIQTFEFKYIPSHQHFENSTCQLYINEQNREYILTKKNDKIIVKKTKSINELIQAINNMKN